MITKSDVLLERVTKMLPKGISEEVIKSVEYDPYSSVDKEAGGSYWVYLDERYISKSTGCHIIHEDNLGELKKAIRGITEVPDWEAEYEIL